jgi:predicted DNA-binding transcriptional regulator AlpA
LTRSSEVERGLEVTMTEGDVFLRWKGVIALVGAGETWIREREKDGRFPKKRTLPGSRVVVWLKSEILEWMAKQVALTDEDKD